MQKILSFLHVRSFVPVNHRLGELKAGKVIFGRGLLGHMRLTASGSQIAITFNEQWSGMRR